MNTRNAREIRRGITLARDVMARRRVAPRMTPFGSAYATPADMLPLWEKAYHHEFSTAVRTGRLKPPPGPSPMAAQMRTSSSSSNGDES